MTTLKERFTNGNLSFYEKVVEKIIGGVLLAFIIGGFTMWSNSKIFETKMEALCKDIGRIENAVSKIIDRFDQHIERLHK